ncbi:hypothetical protein A6C57_25655 [Fibrella sp. ES10-3-2-2]|nr:hypothetical protein A6C57_25655 [Fibrella sp. ES10-3-2-2]
MFTTAELQKMRSYLSDILAGQTQEHKDSAEGTFEGSQELLPLFYRLLDWGTVHDTKSSYRVIKAESTSDRIFIAHLHASIGEFIALFKQYGDWAETR